MKKRGLFGTERPLGRGEARFRHKESGRPSFSRRPKKKTARPAVFFCPDFLVLLTATGWFFLAVAGIINKRDKTPMSRIMTGSKSYEHSFALPDTVSAGTDRALAVLYIPLDDSDSLLSLHARPATFTFGTVTCLSSRDRDNLTGYRRLAFPVLWRRLTGRLRAVSRCRVLHLAATDRARHLVKAAVYVITGRILGKRVILDLITADPFGTLSPWWRLLTPVWRQVACLRAESPQLAKSLRRYRVHSGLRRPSLLAESISPRIIKRVQPRLVALLADRDELALHTLLRTFRTVKSKYPRAEMTIAIAADGTAKPAFLEEFDSPGVTLIDIHTLSSLPALLADADIYLSLFWRPLTDALVLAMRAGLPVITAATGAARKLLHDGVDGLLVEPGDSDAAADAILRLVESPELVARLSTRAPRIAGQFDHPRCDEDLLALYRGRAS
ncbi:MAG: glycosyltransferase, partial [Candidatus Zixiibacteriota bacterium]